MSFLGISGQELAGWLIVLVPVMHLKFGTILELTIWIGTILELTIWIEPLLHLVRGVTACCRCCRSGHCWSLFHSHWTRTGADNVVHVSVMLDPLLDLVKPLPNQIVLEQFLFLHDWALGIGKLGLLGRRHAYKNVAGSTRADEILVFFLAEFVVSYT